MSSSQLLLLRLVLPAHGQVLNKVVEEIYRPRDAPPGFGWCMALGPFLECEQLKGLPCLPATLANRCSGERSLCVYHAFCLCTSAAGCVIVGQLWRVMTEDFLLDLQYGLGVEVDGPMNMLML